MRDSRALVGGLAIALMAALAIAAPAEGAKPFGAYPSCSKNGKKSSRFCFAGDNPVAVFQARTQARLRYRVCVRAARRSTCSKRTTGAAGRISRVPLRARGPGRYTVAWYAGGRRVDRDRLLVHRRALFHVGDSLGVGTKPYLPQALPDWRVRQSVEVARHTPEAISILRHRNGLPGVIVVGAGGNDDPRNVEAFRDSVRAARRIAGPTRCLVWPNLYSRRPIAGTTFAGYNSVLEQFDDRYRSFRVVDWAGIVRRHPGWLAADGVHVNPTGYRARARAIAVQAKRC
jgi:hypothetical protein